jgi:Glycosyltransferase sugar-binding region containing DXD motif
MREGGPPVVQYWDDAEIPDDVARLFAAVEGANPELPHFVFDEKGAAEFLAARFGPRQVGAFAACGVPAMQADYFRYCAVYALGGVYVDADFQCRAPLADLFESPGTGTLFGRPELPPRWRTPEFEWRERVGPYRVVINSFFAFPAAGHPLLELAVEIATANVEARIAEDVALATGPAIFTSLYLLRELGSFEAFLDYVEGGVLEPSAALLRETVGDWDRVGRAFAGVRIPPVEESYAWVVSPEVPLSYKQTKDHWLNATESIYR